MASPIEDPPAEWAQAWEGFVAVYAVPWPTLTEAGRALRAFWEPVTGASPEATWNPGRWEWQRTR